MRVRLLAVTLTFGFIAGCAHRGWRENRAFELQDGDFGLIAGAAVSVIERYGSVNHFVVAPDIDRRAQAALARLRPVIPASRLAGNPALPAGYFLVESFRIDADGNAMIEGDLGPTGCPGGCGRNISMPYLLQGNDWFNPSVKIVDYSQHRDVIPVNPATGKQH